MRRVLPLTALCLLTACRTPEYAAADGRILWDAKGCAFHVEHGAGNTSFVKRLPDTDQPTCPAQH